MNTNIQNARILLAIIGPLLLELEEILRKIKRHKLRSNIVKSVSTGAAAVGTGLMIGGTAVATAATGGAALIVIAPVLGWTGFGVGIAASGATAATEIRDSIISSKMRKKIEYLHEKLQSELNHGPAFLNNIIRLLEVESSMGARVFEAGAAFVQHVNRGWSAIGHLRHAANYTRNGGFLASTAVRNAPVGRIVATSITRSPLIRTSVVGLVFTGMDFYFLYRSWKQPHALKKVVKDLIIKIQACHDLLQCFIDTHEQNNDLPDLSQQDYEFQVEQHDE